MPSVGVKGLALAVVLLLAPASAACAQPGPARLEPIARALGIADVSDPEGFTAGAIEVTVPPLSVELPTIVPPPASPHVFGTLALPAGVTRYDERWQRVRAGPVHSARLDAFIAPARGLAAERQLSFVQTRVNKTVAWRDDRASSGADDHWATAEETLARGGGDCEDLSIVKLQALVRLGFDDRDLYLSIGRDAARQDHALLIVRLGGRFWVLDDRMPGLVAAEDFASFTPIVTLGESFAWIHGERRASR